MRMKSKSQFFLALFLAAIASPLAAYVYPAAAIHPMAAALLSAASSFFAPSVYVAPSVDIAPGIVGPGAMIR